ncbi:hypothetical protein BUALT_Bualt19G0105700 [Buddleja alternifolia]|uniref:Uncharacterized protein n=1 Tax=Buddleja alternifolia TaxID=168488 RepID=A0AAV6W2M6_9LAMI|nr:hypothetical protein BUALT_Bualt19G0105700 [Buddleja alternifolia]
MDANGGFGDDSLDPGCYSDMLFADEISGLETDVTWLCNTSFGFNSNNNNNSTSTSSSQKMVHFGDYATKTGQESGFTCMDSGSLSSKKRNGSGIQNPGPCPGAPIGSHGNSKKSKSENSTVTGHAKFVKKEKLGERITALQQLVSPFGKDDRDNRETERRKEDLRSRGLCLIPVELTLHVAESNGADLWSTVAMVNNVSSSS